MMEIDSSNQAPNNVEVGGSRLQKFIALQRLKEGVTGLLIPLPKEVFYSTFRSDEGNG